MCCCERRRFHQFLPIPVCFPSGRVFFFCFVAAQRSPTFFRNPNVTSHTTKTTHTIPPKKMETPRAASPFFGRFNQPDQGAACFRAAFSSPSATTHSSQNRQTTPRWAERGLTKRIASRLIPSHHCYGAFGWLLHSGREHRFHGVGAASGGPHRRLHLNGGCGRNPTVSTTTWVLSPPLGCRFHWHCFLLSHCHMFLFLFFSSPLFFSSWMFLPAYTPFVVVVYCVVSNHNYVLACTVETTGRKDGIGSTSSGLGKALMNGSLAGNAKGITGSFSWVASIELR